MDLIINWGIIAGINILMTGSILFILYKRVLPSFLQGYSQGVINEMLESIKGANNQKLSVASRLDNTMKKKLGEDLTDPENPIGAVLNILPQTRDYISEHPEQIGGLINFANSIPGIFNFVGTMKSLISGQQDKKVDQF